MSNTDSGFIVAARMAYRGACIIGLLLFGIVVAPTVMLDNDRFLNRERIHRWWQRRLLHVLGLHLRVLGTPLCQPRLVVSNHVSWLDIGLIAACEPMRFVSKSEVADWPIAGRLASGAGTFYIKRGSGGTRLLIEAMSAYLKRGSIAFYPEGTTTEGDRLLRFQPRLFAAAIEAGSLVQPVAVRYGLTRDGRNIAPFVGDDALSTHVLRLMRERSMTVELHYLRPFDPRGMDRAQVAQLAFNAIAEVIAPSLVAPARSRMSGESLAA